MTKYYVKPVFSDWTEVSKENYLRFKAHIVERSNPTNCTPRELAEKLTKIVEE